MLFKSKYAPFFSKKQFGEEKHKKKIIRKLSVAIEDRTEELKQLFEEEDKDITFGDQVIGEVKKFIMLVLLTAMRFYEPCLAQLSGNL